MPQNSTALDFAFSLHTDIGSHCIGAKVNHKLVPLSHKLQSGDQVEVLTSKSQRVQPQWEVFATTARARTKIAAILRKERKANQKIGEELLNEFLKKRKYDREKLSSKSCASSITPRMKKNCWQRLAAKQSFWGKLTKMN